MEKSKNRLLLSQYKSIKEQAKEIQKKLSDMIDKKVAIADVPYARMSVGIELNGIRSDAESETEALIKSYNENRKEAEKILGFKLLKIEHGKSLFRKGHSTALRLLIINCDKVIGYIESLESKIPLELKNKLDSLKEELQVITANINNTDFGKNLEISIEECEKGHYLSSWLISGRVIRYIFEKIPGKDINEKLKFLEDNNIVPKDKKEIVNLILRIDKETRNIGSHNISSFPQPKEAISLITDSLKLLELIWVKLEHLL